MKEIVERLTENRQIELAKSILESEGYSVIREDEIEDNSSDLVNPDYLSSKTWNDMRGVLAQVKSSTSRTRLKDTSEIISINWTERVMGSSVYERIVGSYIDSSALVSGRPKYSYGRTSENEARNFYDVDGGVKVKAQTSGYYDQATRSLKQSFRVEVLPLTKSELSQVDLPRD